MAIWDGAGLSYCTKRVLSDKKSQPLEPPTQRDTSRPPLDSLSPHSLYHPFLPSPFLRRQRRPAFLSSGKNQIISKTKAVAHGATTMRFTRSRSSERTRCYGFEFGHIGLATVVVVLASCVQTTSALYGDNGFQWKFDGNVSISLSLSFHSFLFLFPSGRIFVAAIFVNKASSSPQCSGLCWRGSKKRDAEVY